VLGVLSYLLLQFLLLVDLLELLCLLLLISLVGERAFAGACRRSTPSSWSLLLGSAALGPLLLLTRDLLLLLILLHCLLSFHLPYQIRGVITSASV
jgi:hypothetical protein